MTIKDYKDLHGGLVSKKALSKKIGSLDWHPGPGKVGQKNAKATHLRRPPQRTPNTKQKIFHQSQQEDLLNPQMV